MITTINEHKIFSTNNYDYNNKWTNINNTKIFSTNNYDNNNKYFLQVVMITIINEQT